MNRRPRALVLTMAYRIKFMLLCIYNDSGFPFLRSSPAGQTEYLQKQELVKEIKPNRQEPNIMARVLDTNNVLVKRRAPIYSEYKFLFS